MKIDDKIYNHETMDEALNADYNYYAKKNKVAFTNSAQLGYSNYLDIAIEEINKDYIRKKSPKIPEGIGEFGDGRDYQQYKIS